MRPGERQARWRRENPEKARAQRRRYVAANSEKENQRKRAWEAANPDKVRAQRAKRRSRHSGLSPDERGAILAKQGGTCAICGTDTSGGRGWCGDHDHATGAVRGVLCYACNVTLGYMKDNPERLRAAADYLERHASLQELL